MVAEWNAATVALLSCHAPSHEYPHEQAVDMESSAFFHAASKFSDNEVIQSIKVISDNRTHGIENLNAKYVEQLLLPHTQAIADYAERLMLLIEPIENQTGLLSLVEHLRSTVSQRGLYLDLMSKSHALGLFGEPQRQAIQQANSMPEVLELLRKALSAKPPRAIKIT